MHVFSSFCWCVPWSRQASLISALSAITLNFLLPWRLCVLFPHVHAVHEENKELHKLVCSSMQHCSAETRMFCSSIYIMFHLHIGEALLSTYSPAQWESSITSPPAADQELHWNVLSFLSRSSETQNLLVRTWRCCTSSPPSVKRITSPCWGFQRSWNTWRAPAKVRCRPHANRVADVLQKCHYATCRTHSGGSMSCVFIPPRRVSALWRCGAVACGRSPFSTSSWQECKRPARLSLGPSIN